MRRFTGTTGLHVAPSAGFPARGQRTNVALAALWYAPGGGPERGIVCDVSNQGIFLQPLGEGGVQARLGVGAEVRVVFVARGAQGDQKIDVSAVVRWRGKHPHYASDGFGLEFLSPVELLAPG